jgi:penicillin-binding protein 1A
MHQRWVIAVKLEKQYTKNEIITMYLNKFDFINNAVGIKSAAKIYFNTIPDLLTIEQSATLVGMAKNPALFNPLRRHEITQKRRNVVLHQMMRYQFISRNQYDSLKQIPLQLDFHAEDHNT